MAETCKASPNSLDLAGAIPRTVGRLRRGAYLDGAVGPQAVLVQLAVVEVVAGVEAQDVRHAPRAATRSTTTGISGGNRSRSRTRGTRGMIHQGKEDKYYSASLRLLGELV